MYGTDSIYGYGTERCLSEVTINLNEKGLRINNSEALFFRGKISFFYEREVTIMTMYILALTAVTALLIQMDWMQYKDRRDNND